MQGTIAQLLSLTVHGNCFLSGNSLHEYFPENTTFKFCKYVKFIDIESDGSGWTEIPYADNPFEWLNKIQSEGVYQLRAWHFGSKQEGISDRMSVEFVGGGGRWLIECLKPKESDFWEGRWEAPKGTLVSYVTYRGPVGDFVYLSTMSIIVKQINNVPGGRSRSDHDRAENLPDRSSAAPLYRGKGRRLRKLSGRELHNLIRVQRPRH